MFKPAAGKYPKIRIVGVDLDQTLSLLASNKFPACGNPAKKGFKVLSDFREKTGKAILWTCRSHPDWLNPGIEFCRVYGLEFDAVNEHLPEQFEAFNKCFPGHEEKADGRKIYCDLYIDDKDPASIMRGGIDWDTIDFLLNGDHNWEN